jgi:hypothetical protein
MSWSMDGGQQIVNPKAGEPWISGKIYPEE